MAHPSRLVHRIHDRELKKTLEKHARGSLIDIGCGARPYRDLYSRYVQYSIGVDHTETLHGLSQVNVAGLIYDLPIKKEFFDTALLTVVLEHIEEPSMALGEICRILKPGGVLILSAPLFWHLHEEPRDFFRYTKYGLNYLLVKSGFEILELKALSGFWVTFGVELTYYLHRSTLRAGKVGRGVSRICGHLIQSLSMVLDRIHMDDSFTWAYLVVARKLNRKDVG